ncbi:TetR/AcrR family transcriptional regulator [Paracraurococcus lichenis]|uniref:TetR/AcrR family transcriptional regulator n=1 Tax=Paracraurococcus lichenis TaxID=3064888 RepID=A0ABT9E9L9_9PROT|nr:TetR/AcrR family transcriptional regulator [Paracraurococcus sp. LOR1-02]MDO9712799.1 TetR/AcrR family transcriptional regulator [Paracraurococcus sp. LOR1-02]
MTHVTAPDLLEPAEAASPKRRAILAAATRLFMAEGYGAVSMDAVAKAAAVSKATLYAHFGAKDRLFAAIITEACETMRGLACGEAGAEDLPPRAALRRLGRHWLGFLLDRHAVAVRRIVVAEGPRFPELARAFYDNGPAATRAWLAGWIEGEVARGRLRCADPALAAEQFIALLTGDMMLRATLGLGEAPSATAIEQQVEAAVDTFCHAFVVEASQRGP